MNLAAPLCVVVEAGFSCVVMVVLAVAAPTMTHPALEG